jgi:hypothetical protein
MKSTRPVLTFASHNYNWLVLGIASIFWVTAIHCEQKKTSPNPISPTLNKDSMLIVELNEIRKQRTDDYYALIKNQHNEYWMDLCKDRNMHVLFDCNSDTTDCYQVKFTKPFDNRVMLLTIYFKLGRIFKIYKTELANNLNKHYNKYKYIKHLKKRNITCQYNLPQLVKFNQNTTRLDSFFNYTIWTMPATTDACYLDPEIWEVRGRRNGETKVWGRVNCEDPLFCSNIQSLLNLCGVTEYHF